MEPFLIGVVVAIGFLLFVGTQAIRILPEYERGVVFRLGRLRGQDYGPGLFLLIPVVDRMTRVSLRTVVFDVPPQDVITKDNVSIKVNAVVYFRVVNPRSAIVEVENYHYATSQLSQTTLRSVLGEAEREKRAKIIHAEGEFQAATQLSKAADEIGKNPVTIQLRYLQTLTEIASEKNSTLIFPLPIELLRH